MTVVYFGSVFLHKRVIAYPHVSREVITWDTLLTLGSRRVKLKDVIGDMFTKIREDLTRLKLAKFFGVTKAGALS